jgi:drug/metabolite transporter (DMT)-like permease
MNLPPKQVTLRQQLAFLSLCAIWGTTWLAIRLVVREIPPFFAASARFLIAAVFLAFLAVAQRAHLPRTPREWRAVLVLSITMMALPYGLIFWAEQSVASSVTAVLYSASPLAVALMTPAMTGKAVPRSAIYSLLVGVGGIAILFQVDLRSSMGSLLGGIGVLIGVLSSSWSTIYAKKETREVNPVVSTALQLFVGGIVLAVLSFSLERGQPASWTAVSTTALLFLAIFGSAIAFVLYYWLLRHMDAYKAITINLVVPIIAIIEGGFFAHEIVNPLMLLSALIVLGSVGFTLKAQSDESMQLKLSRPATEGDAE